MTKKLTSLIVFLLWSVISTQAQDATTQPQMIGKDTANTEYLRGEAKRLRQNCESLKSKAQELITLYEGYVARTKECPGAKEEAMLALDMAKKASKDGDTGIKLAEKAEKAKKMKEAKKYLQQIDPRIKSGHEYLKNSDERKKEVEFEMKGC